MTGIGLAKASCSSGLVLQLPFCKGRKVLGNLFVMGKYRVFSVARWQMVRERKIKLCRREEKRKQAERRRGKGKTEKRAEGKKGNGAREPPATD